MVSRRRQPAAPGGDGNGRSLYKDISEFRKDLLRLFLFIVPLALAGVLSEWVKARLADFQPWQAVGVVLPLGLLTWILWQVVKGRQEFKLGGIFAFLFAAYVLLFTIAAGTRMLDWQHSYTRYEESLPPNFLSLNWLGDWRYKLAGNIAPRHNLTIVTLAPAETLEQRRSDLRVLIRMSVQNGARGIFLDLFFEDEAAQPGVDALLCAEIVNAEQEGVPVLVGYTLEDRPGTPVRQVTAASLASCLPMSRHGHLLGFIDWDGTVRSIPLYFLRDRTFPSLSLRAAGLIAETPEEELRKPGDDLLHFVAVRGGFSTVSYNTLRTDPREASVLRDRFLVVGDESERDRFRTPFGTLQGAEVHAYAIHSLLTERFIQRTPWWPNLLMIFASCYLLAVVAAQGADGRSLMGLVAIISVAVVASSAVLILLWLVWLDVIYFLLATWIWTALLLGLRRLRTSGASEGARGS